MSAHLLIDVNAELQIFVTLSDKKGKAQKKERGEIARCAC